MNCVVVSFVVDSSNTVIVFPFIASDWTWGHVDAKEAPFR